MDNKVRTSVSIDKKIMSKIRHYSIDTCKKLNVIFEEALIEYIESKKNCLKESIEND